VWAAIFGLHLADVAYQDGDQGRLRTAIERLPRPDDIPPSFSYHHKSARLNLEIGDLEQALESSKRALQDMEIGGERWCVERGYLTHTRVMRALGRDDEADDYLRRAYERVMLVASKTQDETLRQSWLENVPDNCEIIAEWEARQRE
jgi:hypothetical protein